MSTETTRIILSLLQPQQTELVLPNGFQVQILDSLSEIACSPSSSVKKFQYAAFIREESILLVWHDELDRILVHAENVEGKLLSFICGTSGSVFAPSVNAHPLQRSSLTSPAESTHHVISTWNKEATTPANQTFGSSDEEAAAPIESLDRPLALTSSIFVGLAMCLIIVLLLGFGVSNLLLQVFIDGNYIRLALAATIPIFMLFSIFFVIVIFTDIFQAIGPIKTLKTNSRYYSALRPDLSHAYSLGFKPPRLTIQMPVYTESLNGVIIPTVTSLKAAISHYESHGGSASIFINDDGLAYLSEEQREERINFYHDNNIGWVARPKNNDNGYIRKGKFKKASNMNFALNVSNKVEDRLLEMLSDTLETTDMIEASQEEHLYQLALNEVLASDSRVWAAGDIRIGESILIVDSDTRVPVDCLLYGAAEMFLSPEVAIVQHSTGVMQVSEDYFENGITFFTNLIYSAIRFAVGSGETAPFVGHNAFLRWKAVQSVGKPDDGYVAYWSESHVSEDFDIALRLQIGGNIVRLASYHGDEFKEGVSLTIYDELARWEKYAYGCNELVFNPIHTWLFRGPFTRLFMTFLWCKLPLSSKITILGYISSLFLGLIVVFPLFGNVSLAIIRYRLGEKSLWGALVENFKWVPMMAIFFGGISFHLSLAILSQMFRINMEWGATAKEKDDSNFFKEMPKIFKGFKWMYAVIIPLIGGMVYLGCFAPRGWEITEIAAVVPMAVTLSSHALLPLLLNPSLMIFNY
ncbi:conserved hypothetical protein [Uncinocarpus reesii 1704]|uniref:Uncharacterized protein n=1 Tax=Uncinocarpus reesii (strain UAMH 1704) TaxID=336963 RepID=C4JKK7_UNCRE|nr:uncharacterized protein UREG_02164 [Uncinocarpus reesii 1704]EEP77315.1 conserved hypothetical protein [Uncinocarpus reesii 1704]